MTSRMRTCALALAAVALLGAGCGDDDEQQAQEGPLLANDAPRRAAEPNLVGADRAIEEVAKDFSGRAMEYFDLVFEQNGKTFRRPGVVVVDTPTDTACGAFDPGQRGYLLCLSSAGDRITYGGPYLDRVRSQLGDTGAVFLIGYGVALAAYDQLTGDRLAKRELPKPDEQFIHSSVCLTGAWNGWLLKKELVEPGDEEELLKFAERFASGRTVENVSLGQDIVARGFIGGSRACTEPKEAS